MSTFTIHYDKLEGKATPEELATLQRFHGSLLAAMAAMLGVLSTEWEMVAGLHSCHRFRLNAHQPNGTCIAEFDIKELERLSEEDFENLLYFEKRKPDPN